MPAVQAPTSVTLGSVTCTGVSVTWTDGSNSTYHTCQIFESASSDMSISTPVSPQTPSNSSAVTSGQAFTFTATSTKYYGAIVTAIQDDGINPPTTADSSMSTGVLYVAIAPGNPTSVALGSFTGVGATVTWTSTDPCTESYDCYVYKADTEGDLASAITRTTVGSALAISSISPQTFTFTPTATKWYLATVTANSGGLTSDAIPSSAIEYPAAPNPPTSVTIDSLTGTAIVVTWTAPATGGTVAGYLCQIYQSDNSADMATGGGTRVTVAQYPAEYETVASGQSFTISATSGKYYGAIVTSVNIAGTAASDVSAASLYTAPPGIPTVNAPTNTGSTLNITWNAPGSGGSLTGYVVSVLAGGTLAPSGTLTLGDVTSTTFSPMVSGTAYSFNVYATGPGGSGGQSSTSSTVTYYTPPVAPTSVTVSLLTGMDAGTGLQINWSGDSGADSFNVNIYYKSSSLVTTSDTEVSGSFTSVSTGQNFTFTLVDVTYYAATVTAVNVGGEVTSTISSSVEYIAPPGAPTSIIRSALSGTGMTVAWTAASGATSYTCQIYSSTTSDMQSSRSLVSPQDPANNASVSSPQAFTFTATNGLYYGAIVTAVNAGPAVTASSTTSSFTGSLYTAPPNAPTSVTLVSISPTAIAISWSAPSGGTAVVSYNGAIYKSNSEGDMAAPETRTLVTSATGITSPKSFTITAESGKWYGAIVTSVNTGGSTDSAVSAAGLYSPPSEAPGAPTSIIRSALSGTGMTVAWTAPVGGGAVASYTCQIYQSTTSDMQTSRTLVSPQSPTNSTSVPVSGVTLIQAFLFTALDTYYYGAIVTATNEIGSTASSTTSNFTGSLYTAPPVAHTSVILSSLTGAGATVTWSGGSGTGVTDTCQIYRSSSSNMTSRTLVSSQDPANDATVTSPQVFTFTLVTAKYYAAIITSTNSGGSIESTIPTGTLYTAPPGAPTSIIRSALSGTGITITWTAGSGAASYTCQIYSSTASNMQTSRTLVSPQTPSNSSSVTSPQAFTFTAVDGYYYGAIVTAVNAGGSTASSTVSSFTGSLYTASITCFKEDTKILCKINNTEQYIPIQALRKGDLVKTATNGFKSIDMIGWQEINHTISEKRIPNQLYVCSKANFPEATDDLIITGAHSILVGAITDEQREEIREVLGKIYITGDKYRLPACVDQRTTIYEKEGLCKIYHFALENDNYYMNYGIYANGILIETSSQRYLKEMSTMSLIE